jgi:hypothetical protein
MYTLVMENLEKWVGVENFENYEISSLGRLKNISTGRISKGNYTCAGYLQCSLRKNGSKKFFLMHRLVAQHFIPNPKNKPEVNHLGEKDDNRAFMLEWVTKSENIIHANEYKKKPVERNVKIIMIDEETDEIYKSFYTISDARDEYRHFKDYLDEDVAHRGYFWRTTEHELLKQNKAKKELENKEGEIWVKLEDSIYDKVNQFTHYQVSNFGRIKNHKNTIMKTNFQGNYEKIVLYNGEKKIMSVHQLVIMAFNVPNPENKYSVDHIDMNPKNNCLSNLKWATLAEQVQNKKDQKGVTKLNSRRKVYVTEPDGTLSLYLGAEFVSKEFGCCRTTIRKRIQSGELYKGYKFSYIFWDNLSWEDMSYFD